MKKFPLRFISNTSEPSAKTLKQFSDIPGPRPLPLIGNIWRYLPIIGDYKVDTLFENAQFNRNRYGPLVRESLTKSHTILHLFDPDDIEALFRQDSKYPHRRSHRALLKYRRERPEKYQDGGLFPENGPNWLRQRNQFQQRLMSKSTLDSNLSKIDRVTLLLVDRLKARLGHARHVEVGKFQEDLYRWALETSLLVFLDVDPQSLDDTTRETLTNTLHDALVATDKTEIQTSRWISKPSKCPFYRMLVESQDRLYQFVSRCIDNKRRRRDRLDTNAGDNNQPSYLRDWLDVDKLARKDVISFVIDAMMAGLHTTTYSAMFFLYYVNKSPDIRRRLRIELDQTLGDTLAPLTMSQMDDMTLLRDCLRETLRLKPVSIGTGRLTSQSGLVLRGYDIPRDVMIITQNQSISIDENVYDSPLDFDPDRWARYRSLTRLNRPSPFSTLPFGFGARACIGRRLAEMQIKNLVARLMQNFSMSFISTIRTKTTLVHQIDGDVGLKISTRRDTVT